MSFQQVTTTRYTHVRCTACGHRRPFVRGDRAIDQWKRQHPTECRAGRPPRPHGGAA